MWRLRGIAFLLQLVQLLGTNQPLFAPIQPVFAQLFIIPFNMFVDSLLKFQRHTRPLYEWMLGVHCFVHKRFPCPRQTKSNFKWMTIIHFPLLIAIALLNLSFNHTPFGNRRAVHGDAIFMKITSKHCKLRCFMAPTCLKPR